MLLIVMSLFTCTEYHSNNDIEHILSVFVYKRNADSNWNYHFANERDHSVDTKDKLKCV